MEELVKYFESLEAHIAAQEARITALEEAQQTNEAVIASLEAEVEELKSRPAPEPQVVEKVVEKIVEKPVEVVKEVVVEKVVEVPVAEKPVEVTESQNHVTTTDPEPEVSPVSSGETLDGKGEEPASPKAALYGKPVDDIRLAISLGDRFLYQRELFNQNAELMQRTLNELNALGSFDEAMDYINARFQWDSESNTYQQFIVTLHRRFG